MRSAVYTSFIAFIAQAMAGAEEKVTISNLSVNRVGSPVGTTLDTVSFTLNGADAKNLKCSGKNLAWPEADDIYSCGKSNYSFTVWKGKKADNFHVMVYHDVGDSHADLRGGRDIPTLCDNSQGTGPADEICKQKKPVTFKIDGPVGDSPSRK